MCVYVANLRLMRRVCRKMSTMSSALVDGPEKKYEQTSVKWDNIIGYLSLEGSLTQILEAVHYGLPLDIPEVLDETQ